MAIFLCQISCLSLQCSMKAPALIPGNTSDQGFNLDLKRVYTPNPTGQIVVLTTQVMDGFRLRQKERQRSFTLLLFLGAANTRCDSK